MGKCMTVFVNYYMHTGPEENLDRYILLQSLIVSLLLYIPTSSFFLPHGIDVPRILIAKLTEQFQVKNDVGMG